MGDDCDFGGEPFEGHHDNILLATGMAARHQTIDDGRPIAPPPYTVTAPLEPEPRSVETLKAMSEYAVYMGVDGKWCKMWPHQFRAFKRARDVIIHTGAKQVDGCGRNSYKVKIVDGVYWIQLGGGKYHAVLDYFAPPPPCG